MTDNTIARPLPQTSPPKGWTRNGNTWKAEIGKGARRVAMHISIGETWSVYVYPSPESRQNAARLMESAAAFLRWHDCIATEDCDRCGATTGSAHDSCCANLIGE